MTFGMLNCDCSIDCKSDRGGKRAPGSAVPEASEAKARKERRGLGGCRETAQQVGRVVHAVCERVSRCSAFLRAGSAVCRAQGQRRMRIDAVRQGESKHRLCSHSDSSQLDGTVLYQTTPKKKSIVAWENELNRNQDRMRAKL